MQSASKRLDGTDAKMLKRVLLIGAGRFIGRKLRAAPPARCQEGSRCMPCRGWSGRPETVCAGTPWTRSRVALAKSLWLRGAPRTCLHLAWYAEPGRCWTAPENFLWARGSLGLLQAFAAQGPARVVMAGTCAEYDWRHGWCSEVVMPLAPSTVYGICKHSLQSMLAAYSRQYGPSSAWARIFFLYAPHEHPSRLLPSVIRSLLKGQAA